MTTNQTEPSDLVSTTDILSDDSAVTKMPIVRLRVHLDNPSKIKIHEDGTVGVGTSTDSFTPPDETLKWVVRRGRLTNHPLGWALFYDPEHNAAE